MNYSLVVMSEIVYHKSQYHFVRFWRIFVLFYKNLFLFSDLRGGRPLRPPPLLIRYFKLKWFSGGLDRIY